MFLRRTKRRKFKLKHTYWDKPILKFTPFKPLHKALLNIKFIKNFKKFFFYNALKYKKFFLNKNKFIKKFLRIKMNYLSFFYKIYLSLKKLRRAFLFFFGLRKRKLTPVNRFYYHLKVLTSLEFVWFLEYNILFILIKLRVSWSLQFSFDLIRCGYVFSPHHPTFFKWSYLASFDRLQLVVSLYNFIKIKFFFKKFKKFIKRINYFVWLKFKKKLKKCENRATHLPNKFVRFYFFKFVFFKFVECDYKILSFIFLLPNNCVYYFSYIYLSWLNYWNNRVMNWKFLT